MPKWDTRCFWFEDDGTPLRTSGCPSGNRCGFTHPSDELWDTLPEQRLRPPGYGVRESGRYGGRGGHDSPPPSPSRRRRRSRYRSLSRSRSTSRHRSRERRRRSVNGSEKDGVVDRPKGAERDGSSSTSMAVTNGSCSSSSTVMPPPIFTKKLSERPPPTGPSALRISSPSLQRPAVIKSPQLPWTGEQVPGLRVVSLKSPSLDRPSSSSLSSAQVVPPPPPPSTPPSQPPPPPYPLPEVPEGLTLKIPPRVEAPSPTDKRKMWEERVKLFADVYQAKQDLERCEQMYKYASDISQSNLFPTLTEDDKARHIADLAELIANRDNIKKKHDDAVERLIDQGTWPLGPPPLPSSTKVDEQAEVDRRDILRHVQELNDTAQKMSKILGDIAMNTKPPVLPLPDNEDEDDDDEDDIYAEDTMDMDDNNNTPNDASGSLPSRKRKRLLQGGDEEGATRPAIDPDLPTREELEVYRKWLEKLEGKIVDLDDELVQYEQEVRRSFQHDVENKIQEYDAERKIKERERREREKKIRDEEMSKVNGEAEDLENDVREVGKEVAEAISKIESLKIQLEEEKKQRDVMEEKVAQVNERLQGYIQQRNSNVRTMQTLEGALKAYLSSLSQPSPPATPSVEAVAPTSDYIISQLQEPILQAIREHLQPMLTQSRKDTETLVRDRNMEIVQKIWPRMELVSRLLVTVADKLELENSQTTTTSPVAPQAAPPASVVSTTHPMPPVNAPYHEPVPNLPLRSPVSYQPQWDPR